MAEFTTGYYLAFNFQVSHVSSKCDFPCGITKTDKLEDEWAISQVRSSIDYSHDKPLTTFLTGALNYQVTHHLFPTVSQYHYPAISRIIRDICKEYNIEYKVLPNFTSAFSAHMKHLYQLSRVGISSSKGARVE